VSSLTVFGRPTWTWNLNIGPAWFCSFLLLLKACFIIYFRIWRLTTAKNNCSICIPWWQKFFAEKLLKQVYKIRELQRPRRRRIFWTGAPPPTQWRRRRALVPAQFDSESMPLKDRLLQFPFTQASALFRTHQSKQLSPKQHHITPILKSTIS